MADQQTLVPPQPIADKSVMSSLISAKPMMDAIKQPAEVKSIAPVSLDATKIVAQEAAPFNLAQPAVQALKPVTPALGGSTGLSVAELTKKAVANALLHSGKVAPPVE